MRRSFSLIALILLLLCAGGPFRAGAQDDETRLGEIEEIDLGAVMPTHEDLADIGLDGYAPRFSWTDVLDSEFTNLISGNGLSAQDVHEILQAPGLLRSRGVSYDLQSESSPQDAARRLTIWVDEFQRENGLSDVLDLYLNFEGGEELELSTELGDESQGIQYDDVGVNTETGDEVPSVNFVIAFRWDTYIGQVQITDFETILPDQTPSVEEVESLAELMLERIERVLDEGGPGLETMVVRFETDGDPIAYHQDRYYRIDGLTLPNYGESPDVTEERQDNADESGLEAAYQVEQTILQGEEFAYPFTSRIRLYQDEGAAQAAFADYPDFLAETTQDGEVTLLDEDLDFGDDAFAFETTYDDGSVMTSVFVLLDSYILSAEIQHADETPPLEVVTELAELQADCVADNNCELEIRAPSSVLELVGE